MLVYGLRLLVALITFGVGVAASWLTSSGCPTRYERRTVVVSTRVTVGAPLPLVAPSTLEYSRPFPHPTSRLQSGVLNGMALSKPAALYPAAAKAAGVRGTVVVNVDVDEKGRVTKAEATSGPLMLRESAEDAARCARFDPIELWGRPRDFSGVLTYNFGLQ